MYRAFFDALAAFTDTGIDARAPRARELTQRLSEREYEVMTLVADGLGNDEIADRLSLSPRTIERHLSNVYAKFGLAGRSARAGAAALFARDL
jgi:DNA-binding CsgD family transcriptional regulator